MVAQLSPGQEIEVPIKAVGGTEFARNKKITTEATYNMRITGADVQETSLVNYLGYKSVLNFNAGTSRELYLSTRSNTAYACFDNKIYKINPTLSYTVVGELQTSKGPVFMADNQNNELGIVDGQKYYVYNYGLGSFTTQSLDFKPTYISYQDTFLILTGIDVTGTYIWQISGSNAATSIDPLARTTMQTKADNIQAAIPLLRQMWIIGHMVSEIWYNQGLTPFPYKRDNSTASEYGCVSLTTIAEGFGMLVWFAQNEKSNGSIVYTSGGAINAISNDGLDFLLDSFEHPEDSFGFLFQEDGHIYYQLTFPTDNYSLVYDFTNQEFYNVTDEKMNFHIAKRVIFFGNKLYFISFKDSKLYHMSTDFNTYDGAIVPRIRITPPFRFADNDRFIINKAQIQMANGLTQNGENDRVDLSLSYDGGYTYGTSVGRPMNALGRRKNQFIYNRLGSSNDIRMQFRFWGTGPFVVTNGTAKLIK